MRNSREDILRYTSPPMIVPTSILGARFSLVLSCLVLSCLVLSRSLLLVVFCVRLHRHVAFHLLDTAFYHRALHHTASFLTHFLAAGNVTAELVVGKKTGFLSHLYTKAFFLPRQARDKHREKQHSKKARFLEGSNATDTDYVVMVQDVPAPGNISIKNG